MKDLSPGNGQNSMGCDDSFTEFCIPYPVESLKEKPENEGPEPKLAKLCFPFPSYSIPILRGERERLRGVKEPQARGIGNK